MLKRMVVFVCALALVLSVAGIAASQDKAPELNGQGHVSCPRFYFRKP